MVQRSWSTNKTRTRNVASTQWIAEPDMVVEEEAAMAAGTTPEVDEVAVAEGLDEVAAEPHMLLMESTSQIPIAASPPKNGRPLDPMEVGLQSCKCVNVLLEEQVIVMLHADGDEAPVNATLVPSQSRNTMMMIKRPSQLTPAVIVVEETDVDSVAVRTDNKEVAHPDSLGH
jgi:hypothetical protein